MKNVWKIVNMFGGLQKFKHVRILLPSRAMMPLVIERCGDGPTDNPLFSVAHYYEQNGDLMRDPEVELEMFLGDDGESQFNPISYLQDKLGIYHRCFWKDYDSGKLYRHPSLQREIRSFMNQWDREIQRHGYLAEAMASSERLALSR